MPAENAFPCWTRHPASRPAAVRPLTWRDEAPSILTRGGGLPATLLAYGNGRSYGDVCLNNAGTLVPTRALRRTLAFDRERGILTAESGATLGELAPLLLAAGWFWPVTPGTQHVTLGGAVANDVHGKDHPVRGTFGRHVLGLELWRSDRSPDAPLALTPDGPEPELFRATIGGLGLTGLITRVTVQLAPVPAHGQVESRERAERDCFDPFARWLAAGAAGSDEDKDGFPHRVAWLDTSAPPEELGRGIFSCGRFTSPMTDGEGENHPVAAARTSRLPAVPRGVVPSGLLNPGSVGLLSRLRFHAAVSAGEQRRILPPAAFFYPLDALPGWPALYGPRGFLQHQSVIPRAAGPEPVRELLRALRRGGDASFVSVLKALGPLPSPGMLSFPREGLTLALDVPNRGPATLRTMATLERIVLEAGGRLYPAKDSCGSAAAFRAGYPGWESFARHLDPAFRSDFWRRVAGP